MAEAFLNCFRGMLGESTGKDAVLPLASILLRLTCGTAKINMVLNNASGIVAD